MSFKQWSQAQTDAAKDKAGNKAASVKSTPAAPVEREPSQPGQLPPARKK